MDISEVSALLHIHEKASAHADSLKHIKDAAWAMLQKANEEHAPPAPEPAAATVEPEPEEPVEEGEQ